MLDLNFIRQNPLLVKEKIDQKYFKEKKSIYVDKILTLDNQRKEIIHKKEKIQFKINKLSKIKPDKKTIEQIRKDKEKIKNFNNLLRKIEKKLNYFLIRIPNLPHDSVPVGKSEADNRVIKVYKKKPQFSFSPRDYAELGETLDIIDVKRAAKMSGARFGILKKWGALLEVALIKWLSEYLTKNGFTAIIPPVLVEERAMFGTGFFPTDEREYYKISEDRLYLVGTAEVPLAGMHMDEIFNFNELPKKYWGFSSCFRREAGSYGKDTRGIFRVHQFDKIEMFIYSREEDSWSDFENLRNLMESIYQKLNLHYRIVNICSGELGDANSKKYDLEAWFPAQKKYRELTSCSHDTDFQARRLNIKYRDKNGQKKFVHTMNSTACAIGRTILAILEQNQQKDGSIKIPKVLQPYMMNNKIIKKR